MISCVCLFATLWTVTHQPPLSMGFPRQEYWCGWPFPGDLPNPGTEHRSPASQADCLPSEPQRRQPACKLVEIVEIGKTVTNRSKEKSRKKVIYLWFRSCISGPDTGLRTSVIRKSFPAPMGPLGAFSWNSSWQPGVKS